MKSNFKLCMKSFPSMSHTFRFAAGAVLGACLLSFPSCSDDDPVEGNGSGSGTSSERTISVEAGSMPVAGSLTAQYADYVAGNGLDNLVDGNERTMYSTSHNTFYVRFEGNESVFIDHYAIVSSVGVSANDPYAWILSGSSDNKTWVELDRQEAQRFNTRMLTKEYELHHTEPYQYYQLEIIENNGGDQTSIGEWVLSEGSLDPTASYSVEVKDAESMLYPVGKISSQYNDSPVLEKVTKLLDGDVTTDFSTNYDKFYIKWESYEEVYGNKYTLTASKDDASTAPRSWKFYSSTDGTQWDLQDEQTNQTFEPGETKTYFCKEVTDYSHSIPKHKYYRIDIESNNGASSTRIAEWSVGYKCRNMGDIIYLGSGFYHSEETPMGTDYSWWVRDHSTTPEILEKLQDPNFEPDETKYNYMMDNGEEYKFYWNDQIDVNLYPFGEPLPTDVNQHQIGNCSVLATFGAIAYMYPEFVKSIIHENPDGTYTVDMFTPEGDPVGVALKPTLLHPEEWRENPTWKYGVSSKNDVTAWSCLIEKAMMKYETVYDFYDNHSSANLGGMNASTTCPLYTGRGDGIVIPAGSLSAEQLNVGVKDALAKGWIITGGFSHEILTSDGVTTTGHTWTVVYPNNPSAVIAMRNPWGGCDSAPRPNMDGVLNVLNDGVTPPLVGIDIWHPGAALEYYKRLGLPIGRTECYDIPTYE
ncbi:MAG TPA: hypothetical protein H9818_01780 [Candidatus Phocaeicola gallistercoris]|nr:hypothetical protein [Candidatus Phocaeicola gallistercoris]